MSRGGILVIWNTDRAIAQLPAPGDMLNLDLELPANQSFGRRYMHCQAVVTRVSTHEPGGPRVALQIGQIQFRTCTNGRFAHQTDELGSVLM